VRRTVPFITATLLLLLIPLLQAQGTPPPTPLMLVTRDARRPVPTTLLSGQELIALDDVAALFQVMVREDTLAGGLTITYKGRSIVASTDQPMASVNGRVVTLPAAAVRQGRRWLVPVEFLSRALAPIYDTRIDLRRTSRLLIVGDLRVPRVVGRIDSPGPPTRATLEITPASPVTINVDASRIVVRVEADALDLTLPGSGAGLIDQIRAGDQPTSVAVALQGRAGPARAAASESDNVTRVIIEIPPAGPPAETAAPAPATPTPATPAPGEPAPIPALASRAALQTIVVDPGHGGDEVGARGVKGAEEKHLTLEVARRLKGLIENRLGIRVILTRDEDRTLSLDERAAMANNSKADLFLSLHLNAALSRAVAGAEVFHLRADTDAVDALRSAETDAVSLPVLGGASRRIDVIRWDLAQARHIDTSARLAELLEEGLRAHVTMGPRPLQEGPLRVLTAVDMPAALVEMAYLTNPNQEQLAQSESYQTSIAQAIYEAVLRFRSYLEERRTP
jgi:N-acetylmuramoyl-L-alanine amidase